MREELLRKLERRIKRIEALREEKRKREEDTERFVREKAIPEALEVLRELEAFLSAHGFGTELKHGDLWLSFRMIHRNGDWKGLKILRTGKGFEVQSWFSRDGREYTASGGEYISPETWNREKFEERVLREAEDFLWDEERKARDE